MADKVTAQKGPRAGASRTVSFLHRARDGWSIRVDPPVIIAVDGKLPTWTYLAPHLYIGESEVTPEAYGPLIPGSSGGTDAATGIYWQWDTSVSPMRYRFRATSLLKDFVAESYVTYKGVQYPFSVPFQTVSNGQDGEPGAAGEDGKTGPAGPRGLTGAFIPPPRLWEDYPSDYIFLNGTETDDQSRLRQDVAYTRNAVGNLVAWQCLISHQKGSVSPDKDTQNRWKIYSQNFPAIATDLLLAQKGYIRFISGNRIRLYDDAGAITGQIGAPDAGAAGSADVLTMFLGGSMDEATGLFSSGAEPLFALDALGKAFFGSLSGQRIELDPARKAMLVYGADGSLCAIHSGERLDYTKVAQSTSSSGNVTAAANTVLPLTTISTTGTTQRTAIANRAVSSKGQLKITVPAFTATVNRGSSQTSGSGSSGGMTMVSYSNCTISVGLYVNGMLRKLVNALYVVADALDSPTASGTSSSFTIEDYLESTDTYEVIVRVQTRLGTGGSATVQATGSMTASFLAPNYVAHYGANGWYISTNTQNYIYAIFDDAGKLHVRIVCGGVTLLNSDA